MLGFTRQRLYLLFAGVALVIAGLFIHKSLVGVAISLLLALVVLYDEKIGILYLIIFIPIRPFLTIYNSGFKLIGDLIILLLFIKTVYNHRKNVRELFRFHPFELAFFAFLIIGTISALNTGVSIKAIIVQLRSYGLFYLMFYIVKRMKVTDKEVYEFSITTLVFAVFLSLQGLVEKISVRTLFLPKVWQQMELSSTNAQRIYGLMGGPNETSLFLLIAFFIGFYLLYLAKGKMKAWIYSSLILIGSVMLLTYSRGALLSICAFVPVYLLVLRQFKYLKPLLIIALSACLLSFAVAKVTDYAVKYKVQHDRGQGQAETGGKEKGINRYTNAFSQENIHLSSEDGRVYYFKKAITVFKDRPIMGYGFGTYGGAATLIYSSPIYSKYGIKGNFYSDNQYSQVIAETGVLGLLMLGAIVVSLGKITWQLRRHAIAPILIYFLVTTVVCAAVYNILEMDVYMLYYFIILGYAIRFYQSPKKN